ncbi:hypothetical protein RHMOL_Rhmol05G0131000 [Rhododendron molle]|uniref:Uncharacterized protein n=1 Tax=Rhododendron molle TaxID=49168 RepID=A0ACC0NNQ0_RHOML|nr:hypothetical protein RHMOL_Rhmol05G0131000 [Rhododendron molle]
MTQGCFEISYTLDGHPNCDVDCDEDLIALRTLAKKFRIGRIDVFVHDLTGSNTSLNVGECGDRSSSSLNVGLNVVGSGELIFEIDNGSEMTLSLYDQERKQLKSDGWRIAIKAVVQAKVENPSGLFRIKELMNDNSCGATSLSTSSSRSSSGLIRRIFSEAIRLSPSKRPMDVRKELKKDYGVDVTYRRAWMGVEKARSFVYGDYTKSFKELSWFVDSFKVSNPDSGTHKGCLLAACAKNGNRANVQECDKLLSKLKQDGGVKITEFLSRLENEHWCHPYFPGKRYGELTSNLVECFNNWIRKERRLPITQLVDKIRLKLMDQMCDRRELAAKWKTVICPKWDKKLVELFGLSKTWNVVRANGDLYEVQSDSSVSVDIARRSCSCGDWQLNMFPCVHGVCALKKSKDLNDYMERCFFSESYREAYSKCINPVPRIWQNIDLDTADDVLLPPLCKRPPGRPRTERIPSTGANTRKVTCSRCGQAVNAFFVNPTVA